MLRSVLKSIKKPFPIFSTAHAGMGGRTGNRAISCLDEKNAGKSGSFSQFIKGGHSDATEVEAAEVIITLLPAVVDVPTGTNKSRIWPVGRSETIVCNFTGL